MPWKKYDDMSEEEQARQLERQKRYDSEHTTSVHLKLNTRTDQDIIRWLWKQRNKQGAIKKLIREQIRKEGDNEA